MGFGVGCQDVCCLGRILYGACQIDVDPPPGVPGLRQRPPPSGTRYLIAGTGHGPENVTEMGIRIGILLPTRGVVMANPARPDLDEIWAMARHADQLGYAHVWVGDSIVSKPRNEPVTTLAYVAAITTRVRLGTAVLLPSLRQPVVLASELANLDQLSGGRLLLGVGPGWHVPSAVAEWGAVGQEHGRRADRLEEHIEVWRELWSGHPVTRIGSDFRLREHTIGPLPIQRPGPPILITAGNRGQFIPAALARFGRLGDGIIVSGVEPDECRTLRRLGDQALAAAGRSLGRFPIAAYMTVRLDRDAAAAVRAYESYLSDYYGSQGTHERGLQAAGTPAEVVAAIRAYEAGGVTDLCVRLAGPDQMGQLEQFSAEVLPTFSSTASAAPAQSGRWPAPPAPRRC